MMSEIIIAAEIRTPTSHSHTLLVALNIHTIALNIHTITLNVRTVALNMHTSSPASPPWTT
eukprot:5079906-Pyramimonas_sp.AAC.1